VVRDEDRRPGRVASIGGVKFIQKRLCEVLAVDARTLVWFAQIDGEYTGDHFLTLGECRDAVDGGDFDEYLGEGA